MTNPQLAGLALAYLVIANAVSFTLFGWDKSRARRGARRISERTLIISAVLSGTVGGWVGMSVFRHKTAKRSFQAKMAAASLIDACLLVVALLVLR